MSKSDNANEAQGALTGMIDNLTQEITLARNEKAEQGRDSSGFLVQHVGELKEEQGAQRKLDALKAIQEYKESPTPENAKKFREKFNALKKIAPEDVQLIKDVVGQLGLKNDLMKRTQYMAERGVSGMASDMASSMKAMYTAVKSYGSDKVVAPAAISGKGRANTRDSISSASSER